MEADNDKIKFAGWPGNRLQPESLDPGQVQPDAKDPRVPSRHGRYVEQSSRRRPALVYAASRKWLPVNSRAQVSA